MTTLQEAIERARSTAMSQAAKARIPECGEFAAIAQDLDFVCAALAQQATLVPQEWTNLLAYALQDDMHNRLTPRVVDIAYTAFTLAKRPNAEDGGASDWFNDTKPKVTELIAKLRKDLIEEFAAAPAPAPQAQGLTGCACRWDAADKRVATCERHQGWLDVIQEWSGRAKEAESTLQSAQMAHKAEEVNCDKCVHLHKDLDRYPCDTCIHGVSRTDNFKAKT